LDKVDTVRQTHSVCKRNNVKPECVVTDFSYALIYAVLRSFNKMTTWEYLHGLCCVATGQKHYNTLRNITINVLCCAHVIKAISRRWCKAEKSKNKRQSALVMFAALQRTVTLTDTRRLYKNIHLALRSERNTTSAQEAVKEIENLIDDADIENITARDDDCEKCVSANEETQHEDCLFNHDSSTRQTLKHDSAFAHIFSSSIDSTLLQTGSSNVPDNSLYSPASFDVIRHYIHLWPLWSAVFHCMSDDGTSDECSSKPKVHSNAAVESYFSSLKNARMKGRSR
jgi:hypothetical protein